MTDISSIFSSEKDRLIYQVQSCLLGLATGDALGVPVEFVSRASLKLNPVHDMTGYGSHNQPPGTWSDDSSLSFCLAVSLIHGFDLHHMSSLFLRWKNEGYWSAYGKVFDIGIATNNALSRIENGKVPELAGGTGEFDNGNGSLMRMAPLLFHIYDKSFPERFDKISAVSSITHGHIRTIVSCIIFLEFARLLLLGYKPHQAYQHIIEFLPAQLTKSGVPHNELDLFRRILKEDISLIDEKEIDSSGYVVHTLEASIWCLLTTDNYAGAVLRAVKLGEDTDTTGAVCGALAGLYYGQDGIPKKWLEILAGKDEIMELGMRYAKAIKQP